MVRWSLGLRHLLYCVAGGIASTALPMAGQFLHTGATWGSVFLATGFLAGLVTLASLVDLFLLGGTPRVRYEPLDAGNLTEKERVKVRPRCLACRRILTIWQLPWNRATEFPCPHCGARLTREKIFHLVDGQPCGGAG